MKNKKLNSEYTPRDEANFFSKMIFWWLMPIMLKGYREPLEKDDLYKLQSEDGSQILGKRLSKRWDQELTYLKSKRKKPSFVRAIFKTFRYEIVRAGMFAFAEECIIRIGQPLCLGGLVRYFATDSKEDSQKWVYSLGIVAFGYLYLLTHHPYFFSVMRLGMKIRISSCTLLYDKSLRLSRASLGQTTVGQMVNLLSNDVNRFDNSVLFLHYLWIGPLQTIIVTCILWNVLGPSCLAGIAILIFFVPLQTVMGKVFSKLRLQTASKTDERIRLTSETVNAMRVIKMYAWEIPFTKLLEIARKAEIGIIMKTNYFRSVNMSFFFTSSKIIVFLSLLTYVLSGNILTAEKVFLTTSLINGVRLSMTLFFPYAISIGSEALISCGRIQTFLLMEEKTESKRIEKHSQRPAPQDCSLKCTELTANWDGNPEDAISDISFSVKSGEMFAVIGAIGSGKSSLLQSILGELPLYDGSIKLNGKISYVSQEAWLFSGTIRENILFGQAYNHNRYMNVIKACSLEEDMMMFPDGDNTLTGERGVSLSGGQKARINLARAVYFDADIYLLDDPLSAVDAQVGKKLYEECIMGILKKKVRILVTHQIQYLQNASQILVLSDGREKALGSYRNLMTAGIDFTLHMQDDDDTDINLNSSRRRPSIRTLELINKVTTMRKDSARGSLYGSRQSIIEIPELQSIDPRSSSNFESMHDIPTEGLPIKHTETKQSGSINNKVYLGYFAAGGGFCFHAFLIVTSMVAQILYSGSDVWLSYWTNQEQTEPWINQNENILIQQLNNTEYYNLTNVLYAEDSFRLERNTYVYVYTGMTISLLIMSFVRTVLFYVMCITASRVLHNRMLCSLLRAPVSFFDSHPIGEIQNRFSKDLGQVDDLLPLTLFDFTTIMMTCSGIIIIISIINPLIILPTIFLMGVFLILRLFYIASAREIKRLEGITRSPVFTHLSSSLQGLTTIRAFEAQTQLIGTFDKYQDIHSSAWFLFLCTTRWFGILLDLLTVVYLTVVTISFTTSNDMMAGEVGLAISTAMQLTANFQWGVRQSAEVENNMTSVERVMEYSRIAPEEDPNDIKEEPDPDWPSEGGMSFNKVNLQYKPTEPPVLKNLKFTIKPGKKIGIVGRTGAGKSSLLTTIFRLTDPEGLIEIDGLDTKNVPLQRLRSSISIIPQDPTLFSGTLRYNLDPFFKYEDHNIWKALEEVQLDTLAKEMNSGLEMSIAEGGGNLSVGQRQLVCLARAILRHNKILVMDEATANVDQKTDALIQETIRNKFDDCTVLTIAHRLNTIMDSDMVMVMSCGRLLEYEEPYLLLQKERSIFSSLVRETGTSSANYLTLVAKEAFHKRYELIRNKMNRENNLNLPRNNVIELDDMIKTRL